MFIIVLSLHLPVDFIPSFFTNSSFELFPLDNNNDVPTIPSFNATDIPIVPSSNTIDMLTMLVVDYAHDVSSQLCSKS